MSDPRFEEIVERSLDDIAAGRATLEQCLARWPDQADRLRPVLEPAAVLRAQPRRAARAVDPVVRAAFMRALRETPQQRPHWWTRLLGAPLVPRVPLGSLALRAATIAAPAAIVAVVALLIVFSQPGSPAAAATLTVFDGTVEQWSGGQWVAVADGATIRQGQQVRTGGDSYALLTFPDGSTTALDPLTEVKLRTLKDSEARQVEIDQISGRLWNDVVPDASDGALYVVRAGDALIEVHGTVFETSIADGTTQVTTVEGSVEVTAGQQQVSVNPGELVRVAAHAIAQNEPAPMTPAAVVVDAPVAAALVSPRGLATGVRPDGVIFQQIAGVATNEPNQDDPQVFDLAGVAPGEYTLFLERFAEGSGVVILRTAAGDQRIEIDQSTGTATVQVRIDRVDGVTTVTAIRPIAVPANADAVQFKVAESARTHAAVDLATRVQHGVSEDTRGRPEDKGTPPGQGKPEGSSATATPTAKPTPRGGPPDR